jgi:hypothetical protein
MVPAWGDRRVRRDETQQEAGGRLRLDDRAGLAVCSGSLFN